MSDCHEEAECAYAFDTQAGPVYRSIRVTEEYAEKLARGREHPYVIDMLVWPYPEVLDRLPVLRVYYALNLPQAVARAVEIEIRLREQGLKALLAAVRPAETGETELFFRALEVLESQMPDPVPESIVIGGWACASTDRACDGRQCKPLTWLRTLSEYMNSHLNVRLNNLRKGERFMVPVTNSLVSGTSG